MKKLLVTGSSGLIGSEVAESFHERGFAVHGVDNNQREDLLRPARQYALESGAPAGELPGFTHCNLDIRDRPAVSNSSRPSSPPSSSTPPPSPRTTWPPAFLLTTLMSMPAAR